MIKTMDIRLEQEKKLTHQSQREDNMKGTKRIKRGG